MRVRKPKAPHILNPDGSVDVFVDDGTRHGCYIQAPADSADRQRYMEMIERRADLTPSAVALVRYVIAVADEMTGAR